MDSKEPEIQKLEEIKDAPIPDEQLEEVVGGIVNGKHIAKVIIELSRTGGDKKPYQE
jgi:hypothetical protein